MIIGNFIFTIGFIDGQETVKKSWGMRVLIYWTPEVSFVFSYDPGYQVRWNYIVCSSHWIGCKQRSIKYDIWLIVNLQVRLR